MSLERNSAETGRKFSKVRVQKDENATKAQLDEIERMQKDNASLRGVLIQKDEEMRKALLQKEEEMMSLANNSLKNDQELNDLRRRISEINLKAKTDVESISSMYQNKDKEVQDLVNQ